VSGPLYTYYGDDFTGSTDVLEALAAAGIDTVLFLGPPSDAHRLKFAHCQAFGIAGDSRSRTPEWMDEHLPAIFTSLSSFGAPVIHYKTCSTFDSSPQIGSIGKAMEISRATGLAAARGTTPASPAPTRAGRISFIPIVVCAPHLRRYVVFGNLFAAAGNEIYRVDRHPTMRQHPVTPMYEADLRRHLASQTTLRIGLIDLLTLRASGAEQKLSELIASGDRCILFDGMDKSDLAVTGRLIWQHARETPLFAVGSSGLTHALAQHWNHASTGVPTHPQPDHKLQVVGNAGPGDKLLVVSGSCSPVTERQIKHALAAGYTGIAVDPAALTEATRSTATAERCIAEATTALDRSGKVIVYSSMGPLPNGVHARGERLGQQLGKIVRALISTRSVRRVVLAGGDTSSHAVPQLGLYALTWAANLQPGAPLCRAYSDSPELDGIELVLKGGQVGTEDFFERVRLSR
jgi:3-oxoisoapionate kinase